VLQCSISIQTSPACSSQMLRYQPQSWFEHSKAQGQFFNAITRLQKYHCNLQSLTGANAPSQSTKRPATRRRRRMKTNKLDACQMPACPKCPKRSPGSEKARPPSARNRPARPRRLAQANPCPKIKNAMQQSKHRKPRKNSTFMYIPSNRPEKERKGMVREKQIVASHRSCREA
jgi:hypothetical protein